MDGHDRNPVTEKHDEYHNRIGKERAATEVPQPKAKRLSAKKAKPAKRTARAAKLVGKPAAERGNKKAEVIAMLKRSKGATLAEIMAAMKWQAHTVRGFVSILGSRGGQTIESAKNAAGERVYKIGK